MAPRDGLDNSDGIRIGRALARPQGMGQGRHTGKYKCRGTTPGMEEVEACLEQRSRQGRLERQAHLHPEAVRARLEKTNRHKKTGQGFAGYLHLVLAPRDGLEPPTR